MEACLQAVIDEVGRLRELAADTLVGPREDVDPPDDALAAEWGRLADGAGFRPGGPEGSGELAVTLLYPLGGNASGTPSYEVAVRSDVFFRLRDVEDPPAPCRVGAQLDVVAGAVLDDLRRWRTRLGALRERCGSIANFGHTVTALQEAQRRKVDEMLAAEWAAPADPTKGA